MKCRQLARFCTSQFWLAARGSDRSVTVEARKHTEFAESQERGFWTSATGS